MDNYPPFFIFSLSFRLYLSQHGADRSSWVSVRLDVVVHVELSELRSDHLRSTNNKCRLKRFPNRRFHFCPTTHTTFRYYFRCFSRRNGNLLSFDVFEEEPVMSFFRNGVCAFCCSNCSKIPPHRNPTKQQIHYISIQHSGFD